jgi:site-specific recombinase XerD
VEAPGRGKATQGPTPVAVHLDTATPGTAQADALDAALAAFDLANRAAGLTPRTLSTYREQMRPFLAHCRTQGVTRVEEIKAPVIRSHITALQARGLRDTSVHVAARSIKRFLNFWVEESVLAKSPMQRMKMPALAKTIKPAFGQKEVGKLLDACRSTRERALVIFLLDSGCRAAETVGLVGSSLDLERLEVRVVGKGARERIIPINPATAQALQAYFAERGMPQENEPVWLSAQHTRPLAQSGLNQLLERLGKRAGVAHCHPHTFRRTFCLWSLRAEVNVYVLQRLMGHSDIQVLRPYLAVAHADLKAAQLRGALPTLLQQKAA